MKKDNKKLKVILSIIGFFIGLFVILFCISIVYCFLKELIDFEFKHVFSYLFDPIPLILTGIVALCFLIYGLYLYFKKREKRKPNFYRSDLSLYDKARFLTEKEINKYYGFKDSAIAYKDINNVEVNGLVINSFYKKNSLYFNFANSVHNLVVGTTGTGKTKCLLIPTVLLMAKSKNKPSMLILDIKGEIMEKTFNTVKEEGYETHILDLRKPELSEGYNPLRLIIDYYDRYLKAEDRYKKIELNFCEVEIGNLAKLVVPSFAKGENAFFDNNGRDIFKGILYALLEDYQKGIITKEQFTFQTINNINALSPKDLKKYFEKRDYTSHARRQVSASLLSGYDGDEMNKTTQSSWQTYITAYNQFIDLALQDIVLKSDFEIKNIREKPTAIYILVPDENQSRYPLASLIINQIYSTLVNLSQQDSFIGKRDIHFILDEFANLPKFENIVNWLSVGRERKMFISLFLQSISQLNSKYGQEDAKSIIQNCNMKICIGISEIDDKKYFSSLFGQYTVVTSSASTGYKEESGSTSESLSKANLVNETDLSEMKLGEVYFIELKKHPGHTFLLPIFDERYSKDLGYINLKKEDRSFTQLIENREIYSYTPEREKDSLSLIKERIEKIKRIEKLSDFQDEDNNPFSTNDEDENFINPDFAVPDG